MLGENETRIVGIMGCQNGMAPGGKQTLNECEDTLIIFDHENRHEGYHSNVVMQ